MRKMILAVLALMCLLTACSQPTTEPTETRDNVGKITYAGVCLADGDHAPYQQQLEKELLRLGYYVNFADAKNNQSLQHEQIDDFISRQYDILIVEPVMAAAADVILSRLKAAETPVVLLGKQPSENVLSQWEQACYVGFDPSQPGQIQGQIVLHTADAGDINGDGQVAYAIIAGPEDYESTAMHIDSCTAALAEDGVELQQLSIVYGDHTQQRGQALTEGLLSQFGRDIEVLFCGSDEMALGALQALEVSGRTVNRDIYVVGIGGNADVLSMVRQGQLTGTAMADYEALAKQVAQVAGSLPTLEVEQICIVDYVLKETP